MRQGMHILADRRIRGLFLQALLLVSLNLLLSAALPLLVPRYGALLASAAAAATGLLLLGAIYRYVRARHLQLDQAVRQIQRYIGGDRDARIPCDEEGELNRLFHEINSLAAILNAHAENEGRAKGVLRDALSDISHQLKTPLAALSVYHGILQQESADPETVQRFTALSEQELEQMEHLVQSLLKLASLDAGTLVMEKAEHHISHIMDRLRQRFAFRARQEGKRLTFTGSEAVTLLCDPGWLMEALGNLIQNALDHTGPGDTVSVEWRSLASVVEITVTDSGTGIHPEDLPYLFKRFYRSRFSQDARGVGLGLPLAKAIIEAHSGTVSARSTLGRGAVFTVTFLIPTKL